MWKKQEKVDRGNTVGQQWRKEGVVDQIFMDQLIAEKCTTYNKAEITVFSHVTQAYDKTDQVMWGGNENIWHGRITLEAGQGEG